MILHCNFFDDSNISLLKKRGEHSAIAQLQIQQGNENIIIATLLYSLVLVPKLLEELTSKSENLENFVWASLMLPKDLRLA